MTYDKLVLLAILGLIASTQFVRAAEYNGPVAHIVDGDTFDVRAGSANVRVRLCGVDSPEQGHKDYSKAKDALTALIGGKAVRCVQVGGGTPCDGRSKPTNRNRVVAQCFVEGLDIGTAMVRSGNACDWPKFSGGHYRVDPTTCINPK